MGGKRSDQHSFDPAEAGAADNTDRQDDRQKANDRSRVAESRVEATRESFIPKGAENPALADLKARRERDAEAEKGDA